MERFLKGLGVYLLIFIPGALLWGAATYSFAGNIWIGVLMWAVNAGILTAACADASAF